MTPQIPHPMLDARMLAHLDDAFASLPLNPDAFARHLGRAQLRWEQEHARAEPDARTWALVKMLICGRHARLLAQYITLARWVSEPDHRSPEGDRSISDEGSTSMDPNDDSMMSNVSVLIHRMSEST